MPLASRNTLVALDRSAIISVWVETDQPGSELDLITTARVRERAHGVFYGWWVVSGAFGIQVLLSALLMQSFGAYVPVLQDQFGWSKAQLSAAFSMQRVESGLLGPFQGWMLDRYGPRNVMRVGMTLFGVGLMIFSQINSLTSFYLVFLLIAVGGSLGGFMSLTSTLVNWFVRKRATAMGVAQMGMSVGGLLVPLIAISLTDFGWRNTAFYSGVLVLVIGLPMTQLMRRDPESYGLLPDGETAEEAAIRRREMAERKIEDVDNINFTPQQAMRTRAFWFISLGHGAAVLVVSAVMVHLIVHLNEGLGYSLRAAATVVSLMTIMQMIGLPIGGYLGDRFEKKKDRHDRDVWTRLRVNRSGLRVESGDGHLLCRRPRHRLGNARPVDAGDAGRLFRPQGVCQGHGILVDDRHDRYDKRAASRRDSRRPAGQLSAWFHRSRRRGRARLDLLRLCQQTGSARATTGRRISIRQPRPQPGRLDAR